MRPLRIDGAACLGRTELFFSREPAEQAEARALCELCPGRLPCLDYAVATNAPDGIWGGLDCDERTRVAKNLRARERRMAAADRTHRTSSAAAL